MTRVRVVVLGAITTVLIFASSMVLASQPRDDGIDSAGPVIRGGIGHSLKKSPNTLTGDDFGRLIGASGAGDESLTRDMMLGKCSDLNSVP